MPPNLGKIISDRRLQLGKTLDDVGKEVGVSKSTVQRWESGNIQNMRRDKLVGLARALSTTPAYLMGWTDDPTNEHPQEHSLPSGAMQLTIRRVPLLGNIACGEPIYASEDLSICVPVDLDVKCDFALRCKGDSMIGARIMDGDVVFIRQQPYVDDGSIAAVLIDDDATLKRVYKLSDGRIELRAENPKYPPILVGGEGDTRIYKILGKAVAFQSIVL